MPKGIWQNLFAALALFWAPIAHAQSLTIQGKILDGSGRPITGSATQFRVQVLAPNANRCVLFDETHVIDMSQSSGLFSLNLNNGLATQNAPNTYTLEQAISNQAAFVVNASYCTGATGTATYTPGPTDNRYVVIQFRDPVTMGSSWETIPEMELNPVATAMEARSVGGFRAASLLRVVGGGIPGTAPTLTAADASELQAILAGTSTKYIGRASASGAQMPTYAGAPASPAAGSMWFDSTAGAIKYFDGTTTQTVGTGSGGGSITGATAGTGLSGGGSSGAVTLNLGNTSVTPGSYGGASAVPVITVDAQGRITAASTTAVTGTLPTGTAGEFLKSNGTAWSSSQIKLGDIKNTAGSGALFTGTGCSSAQALYWDSGTDEIKCQAIGGLNASVLSAGTIADARLADVATAGTYRSVTIDAKGRVTGGSNPTTLSGYGITEALVGNSGGVPTLRADLYANIGAAGTTGRLFVSTDTLTLYRDNGSTWEIIGAAGAGSSLSGVTAGAGLTGGGVSGNVTVAMPNVGTAGTYFKVTTDAQGRVSSGAGALVAADIPGLDWTKIASGKPTTLAGYGITDSLVANAGGALSLRAGDTATRGSFGTAGRIYIDTQANAVYYDTGTAWQAVATSTSATSVSVTAPITNSGSATAPNIGMPVASSSSDGYLSAASFTTFTNKLSSALNSAMIFVGNGSNVATGVTPSGDVAMTNAGAFTVNGIKGQAISAQGTAAGQMLRYAGANTWTPGFVAMADLRSTVTGTSAITGNCTASQTLTWNSGTDNLQCQNISIAAASQITGVLPVANGGTGTNSASQGFVFAGPASGGAGAPSFRALAASDLPSSASAWTVAGSDVYRASGNVGIGTSSPLSPLSINSGSATGLTIARPGGPNSNIAYSSSGGTIYAGINANGDFGIGANQDLGTTPIAIFRANGNIGFGMTSPVGQLSFGTSLSTSRGGSYATGSPAASNRNDVINIYENGETKYGIGIHSNALEIYTQASGGQIQLGSRSTDGNGTFNPAMAITGGNVGVGTLTPEDSLHLSKSASATLQFPLRLQNQDYSNTPGTATGIAFKVSPVADQYKAGVAFEREVSFGLGKLHFLVNNTADSTSTTLADSRMTIDRSGNVGIGVTSPSAALHLKAGTATASTASLKFSAGTLLTTPENGAMEYNGTNYYLTVGTTRMAIPLAGGAATYSTVSSGAGTAASPSLTFSSDSDTGIYSSAANTIGLSAGGTKVFDISSAGLASPSTGGAAVTTANGTAAAPTYSFAGDLGTGWFRAAASTLAASTGGTERLRIDASGNVGIGTTSPDATLQVVKTSAGAETIPLALANQSSAANSAVTLDLTPASTSTNSRSAQITAINNGGNQISLAFRTSDANPPVERMRIDNVGKVGIGTTAPVSLLDVMKSGSGQNNLNVRNFSTGYSDSSNFIGARSRGTPASPSHVLNSDRIATFLGVNAVTGNSWAGMHVFATENHSATAQGKSLEFFTTANGGLIDSSKMIINHNGNVGVGTSNPTGKIEAYGTGQQVAAMTDIGPRGDTLALNSDGTTTGSGGALTFGNSQSKGTGSLGFAAIKGMLLNGSGTTTGDIAFSTRGAVTDTALTERMRISSTGNVGIGTTSPTGLLHLRGSQPSFSLTGTEASARTFSIIESTGGLYIKNETDSAGSWNFRNQANNDVMTVLGGGNVGIGTTAPAYPLDIINSAPILRIGTPTLTGGGVYLGNPAHGIVRGYSTGIGTNDLGVYTTNADLYLSSNGQSTGYFVLKNNGNIGIGTNNPGYKLDVQGGGVNASGGFTQTSDIRLKTNLEPLHESLAKVLSLRGIRYDWKDQARFGAEKQIGLVAQDVEKVFPEAVRKNQDGFLSVSYPNLVAPVIEAIRELANQLTRHDDKLAELARKNAELEKKNAELNARLERIERSLASQAPAKTK